MDSRHPDCCGNFWNVFIGSSKAAPGHNPTPKDSERSDSRSSFRMKDSVRNGLIHENWLYQVSKKKPVLKPA